MTVKDFLAINSKLLSACGITTARLDCLILLEDALNTNRTHLLAYPDMELSPEQFLRVNKLIKRRALHEPLAYLRHKTEFYGHEYYIDHRVLEPRPESEAMIEMLLHLSLPKHPHIIDVGTGSGALAITAKLHLPHATVVAIDIDTSCLEVARRNANSHNAQITFIHSDLLKSLPSEFYTSSILLCNLPYVPDRFTINPAAMCEPKHAIFGGQDGLDVYRKLFSQLRLLPQLPSFILTEALPPQHGDLVKEAALAHYSLLQSEDFIQLFG